MTRNRAMLLIVTGRLHELRRIADAASRDDGRHADPVLPVDHPGRHGRARGLPRRRQSPAAFLRSLDRTDMMMGAALAIAFTSYVYAMLMTSVASTLLLLTLSPFLRRRSGLGVDRREPHRMTWPAMGAALVGVALMIGDGFLWPHRRQLRGAGVVPHLCDHAGAGAPQRPERCLAAPSSAGRCVLLGAFASLPICSASRPC